VMGAREPEADGDPLEEGLELIRAGTDTGVALRLVGGLAVRVLCPDFPPRTRAGQDLDLASVSRTRPALTSMLVALGYEPDKRFNALYGHKQLYFASPLGRSVDVLVDHVEMCHDLVFAERIERMPLTLDPTDLLLSKLQIVELNEKDVQDVAYLLGAFPVADGDEPGTIGLERIRSVVADDWGWWRTLTLNCEKVTGLVRGDMAGRVPANAAYDVGAGLETILRAANDVPKGLRWKLRARVGERKRWYRLPQEEEHY
jgi:hypothetical protein